MMGPSHTDTEQRLRKKLNPMVQETACVGSPLDFFKKVPGTIFGSSILFNHLYLDMIAYIHKHLLKRHTSRCQEQIQDVGFLFPETSTGNMSNIQGKPFEVLVSPGSPKPWFHLCQGFPSQWGPKNPPSCL